MQSRFGADSSSRQTHLQIHSALDAIGPERTCHLLMTSKAGSLTGVIADNELFFQHGPAIRKALVQEERGAYYHPELHYFSTDGLVEGNLIAAWRNGETFTQYLWSIRPDSLGLGTDGRRRLR